MSYKSSSLLCLALLLACSSAIHAFDITQLLGQYPEFSTFNKYLTDTKLADQINSRNTITVLAVENSAINAITSKSPEAIKAIISTHVVLDYFDEKKLIEAQASSQQLTTLFQASGLAVNNQGFLKVALVGEGEIAFGSAVSGAPVDATELMRTVTTEPYNISILQVTKPIVAPGVDSQTPASSSGAKAPVPAQSAKAPAAAAQGAKAPVPAQGAKAPAAAQGTKAPVPSSQGAKAPAPAQAAKSPVPAQSAKAPAPLKAAAAPSPSGESIAESPEAAAEAPATSPIGADAPGPVADDAPAADVPASSASTTKMGLVGAVMAFASLFIVM